jgi:acyl phosphate:glycerol-3-phosphate acyltransferase
MDHPWVYSVFGMIAAYLCGSIPTSVWWGRAFHGVDVREHGSHNAGATNTFRVLGAKAGVPVLLIDILKGFLPVRLIPNLSGFAPDSEPWMWFRVALVLATVVGHLYPVFAGFRGGKGVATSLGGIMAVHPGAAAVCVGVFALVFAITRYVSLGSLLAALTYPLAAVLVFHESSRVKIGFALLLCLMVFYTHRQNIIRLWNGKENRMRFSGAERADTSTRSA